MVSRAQDGSVASYAPYNSNYERMYNGASRLGMPAPPSDLFNSAVKRAVLENMGARP